MMADSQDTLEQQVEDIIRTSFAQAGTPELTAGEETETGDKRVIDIDLYRLEGGAVLLVPNTGQNPLDTNAVESTVTPHSETETILSSTASPDDQQEEISDEQEVALATKRVNRSFLLVSLVLLFLLTTGGGSYLYLFPLMASATITITPQAKSLQKEVTVVIAQHPQEGQVQGRELVPINLTASQTVPATGHAHEDATRAQGVITFYNADSSPATIPAGVSFTVRE